MNVIKITEDDRNTPIFMLGNDFYNTAVLIIKLRKPQHIFEIKIFYFLWKINF